MNNITCRQRETAVNRRRRCLWACPSRNRSTATTLILRVLNSSMHVGYVHFSLPPAAPPQWKYLFSERRSVSRRR